MYINNNEQLTKMLVINLIHDEIPFHVQCERLFIHAANYLTGKYTNGFFIHVSYSV